MAIHVEVSVVVDRTLENVFRIFAIEHVQNHPRWDSNIQLEQMTEGDIGVGTMIKRINTRSGSPVEGTMEVVEYELNKSFGIFTKDGPSVEMKSRAEFEAINSNQTRMTLEMDAFGLDEIADEEMMTKQMQTAVENHKCFIEAEV